MKQFFSFLQWLPKYKISYLKNDIVAGLTIGILLIPQGMAYAILAGLPPQYGLYTALIPQLVYMLLGTSSKLAIGPVAMDSLLIAASLSTLSIQSQTEYISLAILLSFLIGTIQIIFGILKLGFIVNFLSKPVINGFTSAIALLIIKSQLKIFFNFESFQIYGLEAAIGIGVIIASILLKRYLPKMPNYIVLVCISIFISFTFNWDLYNIHLIGTIPKGLPNFSIPNITFNNLKLLIPSAITIAFIGYIEAMSINKALEEKKIINDTNSNKELIAIGFSNLLGSFFQSFPATGGFSRTAVNVQSGAKTNAGALLSSAIVVIVLLFLTPIFYYLPKAVLASIILISVIKLIDVSFPQKIWKTNKQEFFLLILTFLTTLFLGVKVGISLGVLASLLLMIYKISNPHIAVLGNIKGTEYYKNIHRFEHDVIERDDLLIIRFDAQLYFGNKDYFKQNFLKLIQKKEHLKGVILCAEAINNIDSSANEMLIQEFLKLKQKGIQILIAGAIGPIRDILFTNGISSVLGKECFFVKTHDAVRFYDLKSPPSQIQNKISHQATL